MDKIEEAKQYLRDNWEDGIECPCCHQNVKLYKRKINTGMCLFLIELYKLNQQEQKSYFAGDILNNIKSGTKSLDYSVMKWWGLIISEKNYDETKKRSGYWILTEKGHNFIDGIISIPEKVLLYNNKRIGFGEDFITIKKALGNKFNYKELMENK